MPHQASPKQSSYSAMSGGNVVAPPTPPSGSTTNDDTLSALIYAVLAGNITQVTTLASNDLDIPPSDSWVIYEACIHGPSMIQALTLHHKVNFNQPMPGQMGDKALHFLLRASACRFVSNKTDTIRMLLREGANPVETDRWGNNALHIVAGSDEQSTRLAILKLFLCHHHCASPDVRLAALSHINVRNKPTLGSMEGNTPLMVAISRSNEDCVQFLLENGADPRVCGEFGQTPLALARANRDWRIVNILLRLTT